MYGIEIVEEAVHNAQKNAARNKITNVSFFCGDVQNMLSEVASDAPELIVIDPPRAGLTKKVVGHILRAEPRQIIYVSCNPATLARDVALLEEGGYALRDVQPVDMFPHTYHIETVVNLLRM